MFGFTFEDVAREFPDKNRVHLARILADMADMYAMKITRAITISFLLIRIRKLTQVQSSPEIV